MDLMNLRRSLLMMQKKAVPTGIYGKDYVWTDNYYLGAISNSTGVPIYTTYYKYTAQFIPCEFLAGKYVIMEGGPNTTSYAGACYYADANEADFITGSSQNTLEKLVPANAKYLRMCTNKAKDVSEVKITEVIPINLCPVATGTEMRNWTAANGSRYYTLTGLDPDSYYTIQVTITSSFESATGRRLYFYADTSSGQFINTASETVPITKTRTTKPNANGEITIAHNTTALTNDEYASSLTNIMVEIGSVAHPFVPYKG